MERKRPLPQHGFESKNNNDVNLQRVKKKRQRACPLGQTPSRLNIASNQTHQTRNIGLEMAQYDPTKTPNYQTKPQTRPHTIPT